MCGICGFYGNFDEKLLCDMSEAIRHRGPDDSGVWIHDNKTIGLGHRRLSIIDLSDRGHQPMFDERKRAVICYNGEVYNYVELRQALEKEGFKFKSETDTEVILNAYLFYGIEFLEKLNGIFALAIYDFSNQKLLLVRDGIGVKPLYYSTGSDGIIFSSELKSLIKSPSLSKEVNPVALSSYLGFLWSPGADTLFKSVKKLLPGEAIIVDGGSIVSKWFFHQLPVGTPRFTGTFTQATNNLDKLLRQAVRRQMVSDVQVGAFLSGGLDSSAVCHYAREFTDRKLECFTIDLNADDLKREGMVNDLPYAREVAAHLGVNLNIIKVDSNCIRFLTKMVYHLDEPQGDPAILNTMFISQLARQNGIKVLLSGTGGDDIFTGYRRHYVLTLERYWSFLPAAVKKELSHIAGRVKPSGVLSRKFKNLFKFAHLDGDRRLGSYFLWSEPDTIRSLINPELLTDIDTEDILSPLLASMRQLPSSVSPLDRMLFLECKHFLADHNLNYTDKMSMSEGVETRVPLLDPDLVEFAFSLPRRFKINGSECKYVFKRTMERHLPHNIVYRTKAGFGAPLRRWLKGELKNDLRSFLSEDTLKKRGLFNPREVHKLVKDNENGEIDASYTLFGLMCIEVWMQEFVD